MTNLELIEKHRAKLQADGVDVEELEVAATILDRVTAGLCQNCGEMGCGCIYCIYAGEEKLPAKKVTDFNKRPPLENFGNTVFGR